MCVCVCVCVEVGGAFNNIGKYVESGLRGRSLAFFGESSAGFLKVYFNEIFYSLRFFLCGRYKYTFYSWLFLFKTSISLYLIICGIEEHKCAVLILR